MTKTCKKCEAIFSPPDSRITYCSRSCAVKDRVRAVRAPLERFEEKYVAEPNSGCWLWIASLYRDGYGKFAQSTAYGRSNVVRAHRFAYEAYVGPIGPGLVIDHLCRNLVCVNPAHLDPVTNTENVMRGQLPTVVAVKTGVCFNGHIGAYVPMPKGSHHLRCRECMREACRRKEARRRGP